MRFLRVRTQYLSIRPVVKDHAEEINIRVFERPVIREPISFQGDSVRNSARMNARRLLHDIQAGLGLPPGPSRGERFSKQLLRWT